VPCHFVCISYTDDSLEYSIVKILYTNNYAAKNKVYSGMKPLIAAVTNKSANGRNLLVGGESI
jgi:hypothetical protein